MSISYKSKMSLADLVNNPVDIQHPSNLLPCERPLIDQQHQPHCVPSPLQITSRVPPSTFEPSKQVFRHNRRAWLDHSRPAQVAASSSPTSIATEVSNTSPTAGRSTRQCARSSQETGNSPGLTASLHSEGQGSHCCDRGLSHQSRPEDCPIEEVDVNELFGEDLDSSDGSAQASNSTPVRSVRMHRQPHERAAPSYMSGALHSTDIRGPSGLASDVSSLPATEQSVHDLTPSTKPVDETSGAKFAPEILSRRHLDHAEYVRTWMEEQRIEQNLSPPTETEEQLRGDDDREEDLYAELLELEPEQDNALRAHDPQLESYQSRSLDHRYRSSESLHTEAVDGDRMDLDVPNSASMDISPLLPSPSCAIRENPLVPKALQSPATRKSTLPPQFQIYEERSGSTSTELVSSHMSQDPLATPLRYTVIDRPDTPRPLDSSTVLHRSVERQILHEPRVRGSTPAYEDRSPSPSPVSHVCDSKSFSDHCDDADMSGVTEFGRSAREGSMPPPPPTSSGASTTASSFPRDGLERIMAKSAASPTHSTTVNISRSPSPLKLERTPSSIQTGVIPPVPPIPLQYTTSGHKHRAYQQPSQATQSSLPLPAAALQIGKPSNAASSLLQIPKQRSRSSRVSQGKNTRIDKSRSITNTGVSHRGPSTSMVETKARNKNQNRARSRGRKVTQLAPQALTKVVTSVFGSDTGSTWDTRREGRTRQALEQVTISSDEAGANACVANKIYDGEGHDSMSTTATVSVVGKPTRKVSGTNSKTFREGTRRSARIRERTPEW